MTALGSFLRRLGFPLSGGFFVGVIGPVLALRVALSPGWNATLEAFVIAAVLSAGFAVGGGLAWRLQLGSHRPLEPGEVRSAVWAQGMLYGMLLLASVWLLWRLAPELLRGLPGPLMAVFYPLTALALGWIATLVACRRSARGDASL